MSPTEDMCISVVLNHPLGSLHHVKGGGRQSNRCFEECKLIVYICFTKCLVHGECEMRALVVAIIIILSLVTVMFVTPSQTVGSHGA